MNPLLLGLLCALPFAAFFACRAWRLREAMDAMAQRRLWRNTAIFTAMSFLVPAGLQAAGPVHPLPLLWILALAILAARTLMKSMGRPVT